ncbi:hypothetical protein MKX01_015439 [Papaver californicum]|nr:hypothetical protein MKX01_015439 [Papaver californicum]
MRFNCVCKSWQLLIQKIAISTFILLRTPNYRTRKSCFLSSKLVLPSEDGLEGGGETFLRQIPLDDKQKRIRIHMLGSCPWFGCVRIYNPSTGESTPWIKSLIKQQEDEKQVHAYCKCSYFGFNPATKEHKVLSLWLVITADGSGNYISDEKSCEVLTVDGKQQNSFRKVDDVLPTSPINLGSSVYVNNSIYWYHREPDKDVGLSIIEFNCATEKFRVISTPNNITDINRFCRTHLMVVV